MPPEVSQTVSVRGQASSQKGPHFLGRVLQEMRSAWSSTSRPHAEDFFAKFPELTELPEAALRVIYEEICLRRQYGEGVSLGEFFNRFPQWQEQLSGLIAEPSSLPALPSFPETGQIFANFELLEVMGQGAEGKVFLARQLDLASRLVVLKVVPVSGHEHLSLARLQHSHIVPLYGVFEQDRQRALCMPYFGKTTVKHLLGALENKPSAERTGRDILAAIDQDEDSRLAHFRQSSSRDLLERCDYVKAWCWIGACLAEALHYAHERNLVHLDIKPTNVLLAADGSPMLLDFHLARPPLCLDEGATSLGGTPAYMPPEQKAACDAIRLGRQMQQAVDARADVYALGVLFYEVLGNGITDIRRQIPLNRLNNKVSGDLQAIVDKCLAERPEDRYASAQDLATDLRCQLEDRPLRIIGTLNPCERWRKWRRRHPLHLAFILLTLACAGALGTVGLMALQKQARERRLAEDSFFQGQQLLQQRQFGQAIDVLSRGLQHAESAGLNNGLVPGLQQHLRRAERSFKADQLHRLADQLRMLTLDDTLDTRTLVVFEIGCKHAWQNAEFFADTQAAMLDPVLELTLRRDLVDLACCWAFVKSQLAGPQRREKGRADAAEVLRKARELCGPSFTLDWEMTLYAEASVPAAMPEQAWDFYCKGRALLRAGKEGEALKMLEKSLDLEPADFWTNYTLGDCCARLGRFEAAVTAFSVCLGQEPASELCYLRRGRALAKLGDWQAARRDFQRGLLLKPNHTELLLERGQAFFDLGQLGAARDDLLQVVSQEPASYSAHYPLARVYVALGDIESARQYLRHLLKAQPEHRAARALLDSLASRKA